MKYIWMWIVTAGSFVFMQWAQHDAIVNTEVDPHVTMVFVLFFGIWGGLTFLFTLAYIIDRIGEKRRVRNNA